MNAEAITLEIPGAAEFLRLARLTVADLGARAGFSYEDVDDLRIAVDELCYAIGAGDESVRLELVYRLSDHRLEVEGACNRTSATDPPSELANAIIHAVVDEFELSSVAGSSRFRFVKSGAAP
ncbi:MAG: hypothetical protein ABJC79_13525 [Acidimicrobiia bacterium]